VPGREADHPSSSSAFLARNFGKGRTQIQAKTEVHNGQCKFVLNHNNISHNCNVCIAGDSTYHVYAMCDVDS
jgi:hypothetical protein